jgi:hypothetical protein
VSAHTFTTSWSVVAEAGRCGPLSFTPVRLSWGLPKFIGGADRLPACDELFVPGWTLRERDHGKSERAYLGQLCRVGTEAIGARLDEIAAEHGGKPLVLCCFEKAGGDASCHRWWFAEWWMQQTGVVVPEIGTLTARRPAGEQTAFALCHEVEPDPAKNPSRPFMAGLGPKKEQP